MSSQTVLLHDKAFDLYLPESRILSEVDRLAAQLNIDYAGKNPLFVAILNGSFMFASDLMKRLHIPCEISFIKVSSYENTSSTGNVTEMLGLKENIEGRHLILLEDIVDTGNTMVALKKTLGEKKPASLEIASLLMKPECLQHDLEVKYTGLKIANDFVIGYGLDYNGLGRNYKDIYKVI